MVATMTPSDTTLIDAARHGDDTAIATLYRRHNPLAEARIRSALFGSPVEPSDITHQAWADIIRVVRGGTEIENLPAYLSTVVQRHLNTLRANSQDESLDRIVDGGAIPRTARSVSAETSFYDQSLAIIQGTIRRPEADPQSTYANDVSVAAAVAQLHGFDTPIIRPRNTVRRDLADNRDNPTFYEDIVLAVRAQISLTSKATIPPPYDPDIADMFTGWSIPDLEELIRLPTRELTCLVIGASAFPSKPAEPHRRILRALLAALSEQPGWTKTMRTLERAWIAEWFAPLAARDRTSCLVTAEAERITAATDWESAADAAIAFPGHPLGRNITTREDVHQRLTRLLHARR